MAWNQPGNNGQDRDPWGSSKPGGNPEGNGNKGGRDQGPPDLDDIFRKLSKRGVQKTHGNSYAGASEHFQPSVHSISFDNAHKLLVWRGQRKKNIRYRLDL